MTQNPLIPKNRKILLCIDSYENGVLQGWFSCAGQPPQSFSSLSQFLLKMEALLNRLQHPQAYTVLRTFSPPPLPEIDDCPQDTPLPRSRITFELRILFRQHTSWQGILTWQEKKLERSFRSVLELILLLDSALRDFDSKEDSQEKIS